MKGIGSVISSAVIILLLCSGIFADAVSFFAWLFLLNYSGPDISLIGEVIVRALTFLTSYSLVGVFFNCKNSKIMSVWYFIISSILGFVFAWIVWKIEQYILIIGIVLGIITLLAIVFLIVKGVMKKRKTKHYEDDKS